MVKHISRLQSKLERTTRERAQLKGTFTEERFLEAMSTVESRVPLPSWIKHVTLTEHGGRQDTYFKRDVVIETDVGKLFLQIKSSQFWADKHNKKIKERDARKKMVGVLVVRKDDTFDQIRKRAVVVLRELYNRVLDLRTRGGK